jgi:hypothetical protein
MVKVMIEGGMCVEEREGKGQITRSVGMERGESKMIKPI